MMIVAVDPRLYRYQFEYMGVIIEELYSSKYALWQGVLQLPAKHSKTDGRIIYY
jgi:hypothetical protein